MVIRGFHFGSSSFTCDVFQQCGTWVIHALEQAIVEPVTMEWWWLHLTLPRVNQHPPVCHGQFPDDPGKENLWSRLPFRVRFFIFEKIQNFQAWFNFYFNSWWLSNIGFRVVKVDTILGTVRIKINTYTGEIKAPKKNRSLNKPKLEHIH